MGGHYNIDVSLMSHSSSSNAAYLLPVGIEYRRGLAEDKPTIPYVATVLDVVPTDIRSITDNVSWGIRTGYAYGLFAGLDIGNNARLEGGYRWFTDIAGYNFSGAYLSAGFRF